MPASSQPTELKSWQETEQLPTEERRAYLQQVLQQREPIKTFSDIKLGDHLVRKGSCFGKVYEHHFICVESESEGRLTIIHYHNTSSEASLRFSSTSSFCSGANSGEVSCIQEVTLPHEGFIESESELQKKGEEVERVVWPDELRRYPVEEVIKRARGRKNEAHYDLVTNNCESFVMWSMCDINFSLQSATMPVKTVCECFKGVMMSLCQLCKSLPDIVECVKQALHWFWPNVIESFEIGCTYGVILALIVDVGWFANSIWRANRQWDEGVLIKTRLEFIEKVVDAIIVHFVQLCQILLPIPFVSGVVGEVVWSLFGYFLSKGLTYRFSASIASAVEAWYSASHDQNHLIAGIPGGEESLSQLPISSSP